MVLIIYLCYITLLSLLLRKWHHRFHSLMITGCNFTFAALMFFCVQIQPNMTAGDIFAAIGSALYAAPSAISFQGNTSLFGPDASYVFFLMSLYTVRTVLALFFREIFVRIRMKWRMFTRKTIYLVTGTRNDAGRFIRDVNRCVPYPAVVYLTDQVSADLPLDAYEADFSFLSQLQNGKNYQVLLLPADDLRNQQLLLELEEVGKRGISLRVTAFTNNELLRIENMVFPHLDLYLLSQEQMAVQDFLFQNRPLARLRQLDPPPAPGHIFRPHAPFSLCIIGFDAFAQEFLLQTYENTSFTTASGTPALDVLVIDHELTDKKAAFLSDFPYFVQASGLQWLDAHVPSDALFQALSARRFHQILVATQDTEENIHLTLRIRRLFVHGTTEQPTPQLVVALFHEDPGAAALLQNDDNVIFQQVNQCQFTYEKLIERSIDRQAESLHRQYQHNSLFTPQWRELDTFTQSSNRAVVWDIPNKLLLAGDISSLNEPEREALFWELAQYEHLRWNAFHFARGWLPLMELTPAEREHCRLKRSAEKRHACLVDWDQLDTLPQQEPGLLKRYDYENVVSLFEARKNV